MVGGRSGGGGVGGGGGGGPGGRKWWALTGRRGARARASGGRAEGRDPQQPRPHSNRHPSPACRWVQTPHRRQHTRARPRPRTLAAAWRTAGDAARQSPSHAAQATRAHAPAPRTRPWPVLPRALRSLPLASRSRGDWTADAVPRHATHCRRALPRAGTHSPRAARDMVEVKRPLHQFLGSWVLDGRDGGVRGQHLERRMWTSLPCAHVRVRCVHARACARPGVSACVRERVFASLARSSVWASDSHVRV